MRKVALLPTLAALIFTAAASTTTYTTTADGCSGKAAQYCTLAVVDQSSNPSTITIDTRVTSTVGAINTLTVGGTSYHGVYSGFVANPDHTTNSFYGSAAFLSDDSTVSANFLFYAYYVKVCSGRGCGGTLGWHYRVLAGSSVTTP
jgi:hypothetical protein